MNNNNNNTNIDIPFTCPITLAKFVEPVIAADGCIYEEKIIQEWLENHNTSPWTQEELRDKNLIRLPMLKKAIQDYEEMLKRLEHNNKQLQEYKTNFTIQSNQALKLRQELKNCYETIHIQVRLMQDINTKVQKESSKLIEQAEQQFSPRYAHSAAVMFAANKEETNLIPKRPVADKRRCCSWRR